MLMLLLLTRLTYAASKGAINILTKNMALDLAKFKIRVNSVSPGWIWSPEVAKVNFRIAEISIATLGPILKSQLS
jgi:NAD(P)-dependent dehydrogenase (short-subunit alcohol dehydrogenase family)